MTGINTVSFRTERGSWGAALLAALPLVAYIGVILLSLPIQHLFSFIGLAGLYNFLWSNVIVGAPLMMVFYLLLLSGTLIGWLKNFPRWSFAYLSWLVIPLISGLGVKGFKDPYLWRIWAPLVITLLIALILRRSFHPLKASWRKLRQDWTVASFTLFGLVEFLLLLFFDEIPGPSAYSVIGIVIAVGVLALGVIVYIRSNRPSLRIAVLLASATLSIALSAGVAAYCWRTFPSHVPGMGDAPTTLISGSIFLLVVATLLIAPGLISALVNRFSPKPPVNQPG